MILPPPNLLVAAETWMEEARHIKENQFAVHVRRGDHAWMNRNEKTWETWDQEKRQQINDAWQVADADFEVAAVQSTCCVHLLYCHNVLTGIVHPIMPLLT